MWSGTNSGSPSLYVNSSGSVGIGTTTPGDSYDTKAVKFEVNGAEELQGGWASYDSGGVFVPCCGVGAANIIHYAGPGNDVGLVLDNYGGSGGASSPGIYFIYATTTAGNISYTSSAVSYNTTSDRRLKENIATTTAGLATLMQVPVEDFDFIGDPSHSRQQGFIAQSLFPIYPEAVTTNGDNGIVPLGPTSTPWSVDYGRLTPLIVSALQDIANISSTFEQNLIAWLGNAQNGLVDLFAENGHFSNELCVGSTCVTPAEFQAMVAAAGQASSEQGGSSGSDNAATSSSDASATPPIIKVQGDNPAIIQVGATYNDLGATITGPQADLNLGIRTYLNGTPSSPIQIDTSQAATDTIDYVATDQSGLTSTTTRTIIVKAPSIAPPDTPSDNASTTTPSLQ